jgi:hypothetical protein
MGFFRNAFDAAVGFFARPGKEKAKVRKVNVDGQDPRPYLGGERPGLWASNHLKEALQVKGWQFVAIRCLAKMVSQADVQIHHVGPKAEQARKMSRLVRKAEAVGNTSEARYWSRELKRLERSHKRQSQNERRAWVKHYSDPMTRSEPSPGGSKPLRHPVPYNDALAELLRRPNPYWSGLTLLFAFAQQLSITGTCYLWRVRNSFGRTKELYVLPTGLLTPRLPSTTFPQGSYYLAPMSTWGWGKIDNMGDWATGRRT